MHSPPKRALVLMLFFVSNMLLSVSPVPADAAQSLKIIRFTPSGVDVPSGRQIIIQFDRPVVSVGRMERDPSEIPITIRPVLKGQWRWLNSDTLALQLDEKNALKLATRYRITVAPGMQAEDGSTLNGKVSHTFVTRRPKVRYTWLKIWLSPGMPVIRLTFDQPVYRSTVRQFIYLQRAGTKSDRTFLIVEPDPQDRQQPIAGDPRRSVEGISRPVPEAKDEARRIWLVRPETDMPIDIGVKLKIEPGLFSAYGPEPGAENRDLVEFHTFPQFAFLGVECSDNNGNALSISPESVPDDRSACNPLRAIALVFNTPVLDEEVSRNVRISPDLAGERIDYDPWAGRNQYSRLSGLHRKDARYRVWLPEVLRAYETYAINSEPGALKDEFGRPLGNGLDMMFYTDHRPPNFVLPYRIAVLEKDVDSDLPLVVTNLDEVRLTYDRLTTDGIDRDRKTLISVPAAEDVSFRVPLHLRGLLGGKSGVVHGTIDSVPGVSKNSWQKRFFAQVTPFHVHVKIGHYNTLVWIVDFRTGLPVEGAQISIIRGKSDELPAGTDPLGEAVTGANGVAMLYGTRRLDPGLELLGYGSRNTGRMYVRVQKGTDFAMLPLTYDFEVDTYRISNGSVSSNIRKHFGHIHTWGTTAQGVYRAGDLIQYKIYVRDQNNATLVKAPREGYSLKVIDPMGKTVHEVQRLTLTGFGAYDGQFVVPEKGAVGWYRFELAAEFYQGNWEPMRVLVSDFTPAPFRVSVELNGQRFLPGSPVQVETSASLHAGGPYVNAAVRVTATLRAMQFRPEHPAAAGFFFDTYPREKSNRQTLHQSQGTLDNKGILPTGFALPESHILFGRMAVEGAVRDERGKYISGSGTAEYVGRDRFVGLRPTRWVLKEDRAARVDVLVTDPAGMPVADTPVLVKVERRQTRAARVKGPGNAFVTKFSHEWLESASCDLTSGKAPIKCEFIPETPGAYRLTATIKDTAGREHRTRLSQWVAGKGRVLWEEGADNRLEIIAEKKKARIGEKMRFLVKNPFPGARALVSLERYGVLKSWVQQFDTSTPVIQFAVEKDFMPGFYLSVLVVSPRVENPSTEKNVDLGKPAFRMGYAAVEVTDPVKQMAVEVKPERNNYKPGEMVRVELRAKPPVKKQREPVEFAIAVLDEAVLDLLSRGRETYDPYTGFYTIDGLDLENYSLLMRLVGRQKFEKKGANPGGGGGLDSGMRSVFKFVSYWNPSILADENGRAAIEFRAPDNLTGWRILAIAVTPTDAMGLGDKSFTVNRPTEIRPVMPNQISAGDRFEGGFSVMNRTDSLRKLTITVTAEGSIVPDAGTDRRRITKTLAAEPYQRQTIWLPLTTSGEGEIRFVARGGDKIDQDAMAFSLPVKRSYSLLTAATYATGDASQAWEQFNIPDQIRTDVGNFSVVVSPTVIGNLEGAFAYLKDYPYECWEQMLTRGVMAGHFERLRAYLPAGFEWEGSDYLPMQTLERAAAFQAPGGGMAYYIPEDSYVSPYLSAYSALAFNWLRRGGYDVADSVEQKLHRYLQELLRRDILPAFYSRGMTATVRAVALAALAEHGSIRKEDLLRYRPHLPQMSLFGKAHYLMAALRLPETGDLRREVAQMIMSQAHQSGGKLVLSETPDSGYTRILGSTLRTQGAVLSALAAYAESAGGRKLVGDLPFKLVRTISQSRENRYHWENTQENMFCMNALSDYSRVYENVKPDMKLMARLDGRLFGQARFKDLRDEPQTFERGLRSEDPGRRATVTIDRQGKGRFYYAARLQYAPRSLPAEPVNAGIEIHREYSVERSGRWQLLRSPLKLERGELVRIDLFVSLPAARNFVVVDDPVPGGLEPVSRDLATASRVDADKAEYPLADSSFRNRFSDWRTFGISRWSFYHRELRHESARFYSEYLPAGNYHLSYTAQAIAPGEFAILPVHTEEMYDPDVYGKGAPAKLVVKMEK